MAVHCLIEAGFSSRLLDCGKLHSLSDEATILHTPGGLALGYPWSAARPLWRARKRSAARLVQPARGVGPVCLPGATGVPARGGRGAAAGGGRVLAGEKVRQRVSEEGGARKMRQLSPYARRCWHRDAAHGPGQVSHAADLPRRRADAGCTAVRRAAAAPQGAAMGVIGTAPIRRTWSRRGGWCDHCCVARVVVGMGRRTGRPHPILAKPKYIS